MSRTFNWSRSFFYKVYKKDIYDYQEDKILSVLHEYMDNMKGSLLDAACGYGNHYLEKLNLNDFSTVGIDIDPTVKERNKLHKDFIICDLHHLRTEYKFSCIVSINTL